jgi:phospholipid transport system substrate-binding protein
MESMRGGPTMRGAARRVLVAAVALIAALAPYPAAANATDTVRGFYDALLNVMHNGPTLGPKGRYETLAPIVERTFDVPYMTRVAVGVPWENLPKDQQEALTKSFANYIAATYAERFDRFSGQKFELLGELPRASGAVVDSRIVRADGTPVNIRYLMRQDGGDWRVADVYLSGTISELATRHSEFSSILERKGAEGLIAELNRKTDSIVSTPRS